jgi:hypothetical protein
MTINFIEDPSMMHHREDPEPDESGKSDHSRERPPARRGVPASPDDGRPATYLRRDVAIPQADGEP